MWFHVLASCMRPDAAVRQMEYVIAAELDSGEWGHWDEQVYGDAFDTLAEEGSSEQMRDLIQRLRAEVTAGSRPGPDDVERHTRHVLDGRPLTDGGEQ
jgi:hypothetical protein